MASKGSSTNLLVNVRNRVLHKLAFFLPGGLTLRPWLHRKRGVRIGSGVFISQYVYIDELHPEAVSIGNNSTLGLRVSIFTHFYWGPRREHGGCKKVVIGDNVYIGPHSVILLGARIGDGAVVHAGSVVTRDIPPNTLWGPPRCGPIGQVTVPLNSAHGYEGFLRGLRPIRKAKKQKTEREKS